MTLGGLVVISAARRSEPTQVIGHSDLASGASVQHGDTLYVSVAEAIYRQSRGEDVDIHLTSTPADEEALSGFRARARRRWESDRLPDGWTRPLPPPSPKDEPQRDLEEFPEDLRALAAQFRAKSTGHRRQRPDT